MAAATIAWNCAGVTTRAADAEFVVRDERVRNKSLRKAGNRRSERCDLFVELLDRGDDGGDEVDVVGTSSPPLFA